MHHILVDLGFGDSGKGAIADRLAAANPESTVVIRYTGGSQAGHNVVIGSKSHVHSSFASGALGGIASHMSAFCPIHPRLLVVEGRTLEAKTSRRLKDYCSIDPLCPIITEVDMSFNKHVSESANKKNTVGVGVGAAMHRHETSPHRIFAIDLLEPTIYKRKVENIIKWYRDQKHFNYRGTQEDTKPPEILKYVQLLCTEQLANEYKNVVYEGAQGVLLDRDHGFFPDVTYGHTTMRNALQILPKGKQAEIHYITRCYHTRHGDGPMGGGKPLNLPDETNVNGWFQGEFRTAQLDIGLLQYAFMVNEAYGGITAAKFERTVHVTCCDRREGLDIRTLFDAIDEMGKQIAWYGADRESKSIRFK